MMAVLHKSKLKRFYVKIPEGLLRFCATIHASNDPKRTKQNLLDIFFMARLLMNLFFNAVEIKFKKFSFG
jgi:hypothetical protein